MGNALFVQDPGASLDRSVDWSGALTVDGNGAPELILDSSWTCSPEGPVLQPWFSALGQATVQVSGMVAGLEYILTNRIETSNGRIDERSIPVRCIDL